MLKSCWSPRKAIGAGPFGRVFRDDVPADPGVYSKGCGNGKTITTEDAHIYAISHQKMIENNLTESQEMYLETIVRLERRDGKARVTDMARELGVSKPSVHIALHELENRGLAEHERYGAILLTPREGTSRRRSPEGTASSPSTCPVFWVFPRRPRKRTPAG